MITYLRMDETRNMPHVSWYHFSIISYLTKFYWIQVWGGNPAKFLRKLTDEEIAFIAQSAANYSELAKAHAAENAKPFEKVEFEKVLRKKFAHQDEEYDSMIGATRDAPPELAPSSPAQ